MMVEVKLFAAARERAGTSTLEVELQPPTTVARLREAIAAQSPALADMLPHMAFAIGSDYADEGDEIKPGDVVAGIPPVSGG